MFRFFVLLFLLSTRISAQDTSAKFEFRIVDSTSASKSDLFSRAPVWIATYYHSAKSVIELSDKEGGKIIGKAIISRPIFTGYNNDICTESILYTLNIDVKDGKYRCILSDFIHGGCYNGRYETTSGGPLNRAVPVTTGKFFGGMSKKEWQAIKDKARSDVVKILASFNEAMKKPIDAPAASNDGY